MITEINNTTIIESFKLEEIERLKEERKLMDFIPRVTLKKDIEILYSWRDYFKKLKVPYAITKGKHGVTLWKEEIAKGEDVETFSNKNIKVYSACPRKFFYKTRD